MYLHGSLPHAGEGDDVASSEGFSPFEQAQDQLAVILIYLIAADQRDVDIFGLFGHGYFSVAPILPQGWPHHSRGTIGRQGQCGCKKFDERGQKDKSF